MEPINAIAKVRFSSARAQRVHLLPEPPVPTDLLCLEAGQEMELPGPGALYIVAGTATLTVGTASVQMAVGHLIVAAEGTLANHDRQRLVCLLFEAIV